MGKSWIAESIMKEYKNKKKYQFKEKMQQFQKKNCINCKNKNTNKCNITEDLEGNLKCVYYEI